MLKKVLLFLLLGACGFRPVFSGNDTDIYVAPISGINGIEMRNALNAKFGGQKEANAKYTLTIQLKEPAIRHKALDQTGAATWQEIYLVATYKLTAGDTVVGKGRESASESYTFVQYLVASNASYNNAVSNTITVLADKIGNYAIAAAYDYEHRDNADK